MPLNSDCASYRLDRAWKLNQHAIAGGLDEMAVASRDRRVDQFAAVRPERPQGADLVGAHQPGITRDIGRQDRR